KAILTIKLTAYHRPISICFVGKKLFLIFNKMFTISPCAYPSTFQHFAGDAYYIAHNSTRIGFNTFLVEKTIVCFQFKGFFNRKVLFFPGIERNSQEVRFFSFLRI
ncbi:hypothetical protein, partial [Aeromonas caviae]|uniref:hypothetical protein n=1 Tax=Aeromonas caviae TaxID=648 RepID=UPI001CC56AA9